MKSAFYKIKTENSTYPETPENPSRQGITYSLTLEKFQWVLNILWDTREFVGCCSSWNNDDFWHWPCLSEVPDDLFSFLGIFFQTWRLANRFRVSDFFSQILYMTILTILSLETYKFVQKDSNGPDHFWKSIDSPKLYFRKLYQYIYLLQFI